jgi:hypothetical protein
MTPNRRPLTAEEKEAGSDVPAEQSELILEESERRTADRNAAPGTVLEHRTSDEATPPVD